MTLRQDVNPNWPAAYHGGTLALAGIFFAFQGEELTKAWRVSLRIAMALTALVVVGFPAAELLFKVTPLKAQRRTYWGYPELSANIASHNPEQRPCHHRQGPPRRRFGVRLQHAEQAGGSCLERGQQNLPSIRFLAWPRSRNPQPPQSSNSVAKRMLPKSATGCGSPSTTSSFSPNMGSIPRETIPRFKVYRTSPLKSWPSPIEAHDASET